MQNWEDILAGYLEGTESRADADALRWKIHLPIDAREEAEAVLRLADEVGAALGSVAVPEGAVSRMRAGLRTAPEWNVPKGLPAPRPGDAAPAAAPRRRPEDLANLFTEGTFTEGGAGAAEAAALEGSGWPDEDLAGQFRQSRSMASSLADLSRRRPPEGAADRLIARFRSEFVEGDPPIDESVAKHFLDRLRLGAPRPGPLPAVPDVLAASTESAEDPAGAEPQDPSDAE